MPVITVSPQSDPSFEHPVLEIDGKMFPDVFDENHIRNVPNVKLRDDDVIVCGYMRAGTHWMFEILNMLLQGNTKTFPDRKESLHLENDGSIGKIDTYPSPRVLSSHLFFEELPLETFERKKKIVYLIRDPRDSLKSWYTCVTKILKAYKPDWHLPFSKWLELSNDGKIEWGSWFQNIHSWEKALEQHPDHPIHVVFYEDLLQDTVGNIMRLRDFLHLDRDDDLCRQISERTRFQQMKKDKEPYTERFGGSAVHYDKGVVGTWRSLFTPDISESFEKLFEKEMAGSRFRKRYTISNS